MRNKKIKYLTLVLLILFGCESRDPEPINYRMLEKRADNIHYKIYTDKAYSGPVFNIDGKSSEGILKDGMWVNDLKFYNSDGNIIRIIKYSNRGILKTDKSFDNELRLNGISREYYTNGEIKTEENYVNGKKQGSYKNFYRTGELLREDVYYNDKMNGISTMYHRNGIIKKESFYSNGKKEGTFKTFDNLGNILQEENYSVGKKNGVFKFYFSNQSIKSIENYKNGKKNGTFEYYTLDHSTENNPDSKLERVESYKNGKKNGAFKYYDRRGFGDRKKTLSIVKEEFYENDEKTGTWKEYKYDYHTLTGFTQELVASETFVKGGLDGPFKKFKDKNPNLIIEEGTYDKGIKVGYWKYYEVYTQKYMDGSTTQTTKISSEGKYVNGIKNGKWKEYRHGGQYIEGSYDNSGGIETYLTTGDNIATYNYKNNIKDGPFEIENTASGLSITTVTKGKYVNGVKDPLTKIYKKGFRGNLEYMGSYKNKKKHGFWIETGEGPPNYPGTLEGKYENGKKHGDWKSKGDNGKHMRTIVYEYGEIVDYK